MFMSVNDSILYGFITYVTYITQGKEPRKVISIGIKGSEKEQISTEIKQGDQIFKFMMKGQGFFN
jgi:hypothetical protein